MPLSLQDKEFLQGPFQAIEGWCIDEAAWLTTHLLRYQQQHGLSAPVIEIGVYKGKYLSVLAHCAQSEQLDVFGFDTYEWVEREVVEKTLQGAFSTLENVHLIAGDSTKMSAEILRGHLGGRDTGFISIDGAHTPDAVYSDLLLADSVLAPWGIVSIDDFLNYRAIGVLDGAMRFLQTPGVRLAPFCFCQNKLFVATREYVDRYAAQIPLFCDENSQLPRAAEMLSLKEKQGVHWVRQQFLGQQLWLI